MKDLVTLVIEGISRALFVSTWADEVERMGGSFPAGAELMVVAPPTPQAEVYAAYRLLGRIEQLNTGIAVLVSQAVRADDNEDPDEDYLRTFGHYLAMQSLGHGVSWFDDHAEFELKLPHIEHELSEEGCKAARAYAEKA